MKKNKDYIRGFYDGREFERQQTINWLKTADLRKLSSGALKSVIDAHGPITKEMIGSAAKRIKGMFKEERLRIAEKYKQRALAQLAEQEAYIPQVDGSIPSRPTNRKEA